MGVFERSVLQRQPVVQVKIVHPFGQRAKA
jgi:hypothetical protein